MESFILKALFRLHADTANGSLRECLGLLRLRESMERGWHTLTSKASTLYVVF